MELNTLAIVWGAAQTPLRFNTGAVSLVYLVYLVSLVSLVYLVYLVFLVSKGGVVFTPSPWLMLVPQ